MKYLRSIPKTVIILGIASFFTDISSEMIYPLLPVFLTTVLGASALELGLIEGIAEATASIFKIFSGIWTDKTGKRKPLIIFGYTISSLFRPLIGLANIWPIVLVLRFVDRVGKGIRTSPRDALIADVTDPSRRGKAFGFHRAMDHTGAIVGPIVASLLLLIPGMNLRWVFLIAGVPALIAMIILIGGILEPPTPKPLENNATFFKNWKNLTPNFKLLLIALVVFTLGNCSDTFLLIKLSQEGVSTKWIALLWSILHVVKMTSSLLGGRLADQFDKKRVMATGWLLYALCFFAFAYFKTEFALVSTFLVYGIYYGLVEPTERALVSELVPSNLRGSAFGFYYFTVGIGILPASILFGFVWKTLGVSAAFIMGGILALSGTILLLSIVKNRGLLTPT